jgi:hypothetical protein
MIHRGSYAADPKRFLNRSDTDLAFRRKTDMETGIELADLCVYPIARYIPIIAS